ncbi:MAG: hypothetical protein GF414_04460 [Candidatus Altiarchaeales archaeon]|nr:hypothetical protein [Candidatus Altiarchaeales archaeon]
MKLTAQLVDGEIVVQQEGGYCPESAIILRGIAQHVRKERGIFWHYPYSQGAVLGLVEAAHLLEADLITRGELEERIDNIHNENERETQVRRLIQRYMDDESLPMTPYESVSDNPPWRHQILAYHWAMRVNCVYIAHKPGLGKTASGAAIIRGKWEAGQVRSPETFLVEGHVSAFDDRVWIDEHYAMRGGVLIICPKVVLGTWRDELLKWQGIDSLVIASGTRSSKLYKSGWTWPVHVCTYDSLDILQDNEYDGIIADEAHSLANEDTARYPKALHLRNKAKWVVAMSGTPVSNMLPSLWAQYFWLDGGRTLTASDQSYKRLYFDGSNRKPTPKSGAAELIAARVSRITYFLTMAEAFKDRDTAKVQQIMRVDMTRDQSKYYSQLRNELYADIQSGHVSAIDISTRMVKLLQICQGFIKDDFGQIYRFGSSKLDALRDMLTGQGDLTDRKVIVWCRFRSDLEHVVETLEARGVRTLHLHGDYGNRDRDVIKEAWNTDPTYRVFVGMIQLGIGINLHAPNCVGLDGKPDRCSTTVYYGWDWKVTQLEQSMDRVYRGDQVETCLYRYLICDDLEEADQDGDPIRPIDSRMYDTLMTKMHEAEGLSEDSLEYVRSLL